MFGRFFLFSFFFVVPSLAHENNQAPFFSFRRAEDGGVYFGGWARMAQPITQFAVVEVAKPNVGENKPSRVRADITINLSVRKEIKTEWENLRKHDVCFLITVKPPNPIGN